MGISDKRDHRQLYHAEVNMKLATKPKMTLPPDPIGDALADCYTFLLRKVEAKEMPLVAEQLSGREVVREKVEAVHELEQLEA